MGELNRVPVLPFWIKSSNMRRIASGEEILISVPGESEYFRRMVLALGPVKSTKYLTNRASGSVDMKCGTPGP